jgi:hypothetical protein
MFNKIGLCVGLKNIFFQANTIAGFDGSKFVFLSHLE